MLHAPYTRGVALIAMSVLLGCPAVAAPPAGQDKVSSLIYGFADISGDLHKLQAQQAALVQQRAAIDASGADLAKRQDALNQQAQAHNEQAADQQKNLAASQSACTGPDNSSTAMHVKDCDEVIKKLNKQSAEINASMAPLQAQQSELDLAYGQYNQSANDWSVQEQQNTTSLNSLYRSLNDWADQADALITSESFQDEILVDHAEKYCPRHGLSSGTLSVQKLTQYADSADRCLKHIAAERRAAHGAQ